MKFVKPKLIIILICVNVCAFGYFGLSRASEVIALNQLTIYIDPGHGGKDGGAIANDGTYEKEIVLDVSLKLKEYFEAIGINVLLTRSGDYDLAPNEAVNRKRLDILKRVELINNSQAVLFISIHANSYPSNNISGAQTFFNESNYAALDLAKFIQKSLIEILLNTDRSALGINEKYILDNCTKPGVIVEIGFMSNLEEMKKLKTDEYQDYIAKAIYLGTLNYLENS